MNPTDYTSERLSLIRNLPSVYKWCDKYHLIQPIKHKWAQYEFLLVHLLLITLALLALIASISNHYISLLWEHAGPLCLFTMLLSLKAPYAHIEFLLTEHAYQIQNNHRYEFNSNLNKELWLLINRYSHTIRYIFLLRIPTVLVLTTAGLQSVGHCPIWQDTPPAILTLCTYLLIRINNEVILLRKHLKKTESTSGQTTLQ